MNKLTRFLDPARLLFSTEQGGIWLVAVVGLALSLAALHLIQQQLEAHKMLDFGWVAHNRTRALNRGIENSLLAITTVRDLYMASKRVDAGEFKIFTQPLLERHPGIQALIWVPRITHAQRASFEHSLVDKARPVPITEAGPHFDLMHARDREEYLPAQFIAPEGSKDFAKGFDLSSNAEYLSLLKRSEESGQLAASSRIGFSSGDGEADYAFMVSLPVFERDGSLNSPRPQTEKPLGFVVGLFRLSSLTKAAISILEPRGVELLILDESAKDDKRFLHFYASRLAPRSVEAANYRAWQNDKTESKVAERIEVADREWSIVCGRTDHFRSAEAFHQGPWVVLAGGLLFTFLLSFYLFRIREHMHHRLAMEQQLGEREELFRQMTETVDEAFWAASADGSNLLYLSPAYQKIVGSVDDGSEQITLLNAVHDEDQGVFLEAMNRLQRGASEVEIVHRLKQSDKALRWIRTRGFTVVDENDEILRLVGYSEDITERKLADEALRESEAKLRDLFQQSPDIILTVDERGKILLINRSIPELPADLAIGRNSLALMPSEFRKWYRRALKSVFDDAEIHNFQYSTDDGVYWEGRIVPIRAEGPVTAAMVVATDVTEKRSLETQSLRNARLASIGVLAAGVAHEINNPNNAIQFNASLVSRVWTDVTPVLEEYREAHGDFAIGGLSFSESRETLPQLLSEIIHNAQRIKRIVGNLKHMARQDTGELSEAVDIQQVLEATLMLLHNQIQKHTDTCPLDVPDNLPKVKGNSQQLEQVFINILLNALQSLPDRTRGVFINVVHDPIEQCLSIQFRDEGKGVSAYDIGRLTEPFFTTRTNTGGTGLGLSISRSIIEKHGGALIFESELGVGTKVLIRIPIAGRS